MTQAVADRVEKVRRQAHLPILKKLAQLRWDAQEPEQTTRIRFPLLRHSLHEMIDLIGLFGAAKITTNIPPHILYRHTPDVLGRFHRFGLLADDSDNRAS